VKKLTPVAADVHVQLTNIPVSQMSGVRPGRSQIIAQHTIIGRRLAAGRPVNNVADDIRRPALSGRAAAF